MIGCVAKAVGTASSFTISIRTPAGAKLRLLIDVFCRSWNLAEASSQAPPAPPDFLNKPLAGMPGERCYRLLQGEVLACKDTWNCWEELAIFTSQRCFFLAVATIELSLSRSTSTSVAVHQRAGGPVGHLDMSRLGCIRSQCDHQGHEPRRSDQVLQDAKWVRFGVQQTIRTIHICWQFNDSKAWHDRLAWFLSRTL